MTSREIPRSTGRHVVAHDPDGSHVVIEPLERRMLELLEASRNDSTELHKYLAEPQLLIEPNVDAVGDQMPSAKARGFRNELIERHANRRIVRGDDGTCARSNNYVEGNAVSDEFLQHAEMARSAQASAAEDERNTDGRYDGVLQRAPSRPCALGVQ